MHTYKWNSRWFIGSLKCALLESEKEFPNQALTSATGKRSQTALLPLSFACDTYNFVLVLQVLKALQNILRFFLAISQESNLYFLPGKAAMNLMNKQDTRPKLQGAFICFRGYIFYLRVSADIQGKACLFQTWHSS